MVPNGCLTKAKTNQRMPKKKKQDIPKSDDLIRRRTTFVSRVYAAEKNNN